MGKIELKIQGGVTRIIKHKQIEKSVPLNKRWDPYLSDFLNSVALKISHNHSFYPDLIDLNRKNIRLTRIFKEFSKRTDMDMRSTASVLLGGVGVGKSSFLAWFRKRSEERGLIIAQKDLNNYPTTVSEEKTVEELHYDLYHDLLNTFNRYFSEKLQMRAELRSYFDRELTALKKRAKGQKYPNWKAGFLNQSDDFRKKFPNYNKIKLLTLLIDGANKIYGKPVWMLIDNIDRLPPHIQQIVIELSYNIYEKIIESARASGMYVHFHLITSARPETITRYDFDFSKFYPIAYPKPRIIQISKKKLFSALDEVAQEEEDMQTELIMEEATFKGIKEISNHIKKAIDDAFNHFTEYKHFPKQRLGSDKWHLALVNNNVRRFIRPWSGILLSGNFINDLVFPDQRRGKSREYNVHRYFKMLVKGRYSHFPGNDKIDGYGYNVNSPLFFNLFGLRKEPGINNTTYIKNYLIYVRILQYLIGHEYEHGVSYKTFKKDLSLFFDEYIIVRATKLLLWTRLIDEVSTGARDIGPKRDINEIKLYDHSEIAASETTKLYFHYILHEYDYLSSMSLVSQQLKELDVVKRCDFNDVSVSIANSGLHFMESWLLILIANYKTYKNKNILSHFNEFFLNKKVTSRPWLKSMESCIEALKLKSKYAHEMGQMDKNKCLNYFSVVLEGMKDCGTGLIYKYLGENYLDNIDDNEL